MAEEALYRVSEVAAKLQLASTTLYGWIEHGYIQAITLPNKQYRITQATLDYLIENVVPIEHRKPTTEGPLYLRNNRG